MKGLATFLRKLRLGQILTVFFAGVLLFTSTACNSGDVRGARPNNPPVQAGGMNNPHKGGGDGYTNFKASTDPRANNQTARTGRERADLQILGRQLIATSTNNSEEILYPGAESRAGRFEKEQQLPIKTERDFEQAQPGGQNQRQSDLGDRISNRLERVQETFKDASGFVQNKAEEAQSRPEMQPNPAKY